LETGAVHWLRTSAQSDSTTPDCLAADVDAALEEQVFQVPLAQRNRTYFSITTLMGLGDELNA